MILEEFVNLVEKNLKKNGFPQNSVTFPLEKMYEEADKHGFSFNKVREELEKKRILSFLQDTKILFAPYNVLEKDDNQIDTCEPQNTKESEYGESNLFQIAERMLGKLSPEQRAEVDRAMKNISAEELMQLRENWEKMAPEEKNKIIKIMDS